MGRTWQTSQYSLVGKLLYPDSYKKAERRNAAAKAENDARDKDVAAKNVAAKNAAAKDAAAKDDAFAVLKGEKKPAFDEKYKAFENSQKNIFKTVPSESYSIHTGARMVDGGLLVDWYDKTKEYNPDGWREEWISISEVLDLKNSMDKNVFCTALEFYAKLKS